MVEINLYYTACELTTREASFDRLRAGFGVLLDETGVIDQLREDTQFLPDATR